MALVLDEKRTCKSCGLTGTFEDLHFEPEMTWPDGRRYKVRQFRCQGCGALDIVRRDTDEANKEHKHSKGQASPGDGLRMTVEPIHESG